jgi:hypothetical protein
MRPQPRVLPRRRVQSEPERLYHHTHSGTPPQPDYRTSVHPSRKHISTRTPATSWQPRVSARQAPTHTRQVRGPHCSLWVRHR